MHRSRNSGFSLVELMVAAVIGIIGSIIIFQVFSVFENQKRNTTSGGDAETNLSIATSAFEQAAQQAGYGMNFASHLGCTVHQWKDPAGPITPPATVMPPGVYNTMVLAPILLERNPDSTLKSITFVRTRGDSSYAVTQLRVPFITSFEEDIKPANIYGFHQGDVLLFAEKKDTSDPKKINHITCAVTDVRTLELPPPAENPPGNTIPQRIVHTRGDYVKPETGTVTYYTQYNKAGGLGTLQTSPTPILVPDAETRFKFSGSAFIMNIGQVIKGSDWSLHRTQFSLSNGQLLEGDPAGGKAYPLVDGVVFMDAQLGMAATPKRTASETSVIYYKEMPKDADPDVMPRVAQEDWFKLRTVRIAMVVRTSQFDKNYTSPSSYSFWDSSLTTTYVVPSSDRNYRHKVVEMVIPLRNFYWRP